jgi:methionyl-tRNA synthetase
MNKRDIFIGGAWPYANYFLHVGHLAALLPGDLLAKYYRGKGDNVIYVSGSDCHGTPITERAKKEGVDPYQIAEYYHTEFAKTFDRLGFEYDEYSTTMSEHHKEYVKEKFKKMIENGYIYEKEVEQDYCDECKTFLSDREIEGICPHCGGKSTGDQCDKCGASLDSTEVLDKHCKKCHSKTILKNNKHLYFKLTEFENGLQELINKNKLTWRKNALGEAQKYIDMGLVDRAATRQLDWGVEVPVEGYEDKRIYVWIEAVLGYLSVGEEVAKSRGIDFDKFLSDDNANLKTYYVHGKDNIPFHTTIYPALLLSLKENYRLPDYIVSSAYVNLNNEKMSKSKGNLITANELLDMFESDTLRFYFSFKGPETNDMNCSIDDIIQTHNKFLVGMLGNFVNRNLSFIKKKFDGNITEGTIDEKIKEATNKTYHLAGEYFEKGEIKNAVTSIMEYVNLANKYYDSREPWKQVKENISDFNDTTYTCLYMIANLSNLIEPVLPNASTKIKRMLNLNPYKWEEEMISGDYKLTDVEILYNRLEEKKTELVSDNSKKR